jgi:hypothetical protein
LALFALDLVGVAIVIWRSMRKMSDRQTKTTGHAWAALARIDRFAAYFKLAILVGCTIEAALLGGLVWLMDFRNPTHWMLLIGCVGSYSIVIMAIVALGAHVSLVGQRILKALEVAAEK